MPGWVGLGGRSGGVLSRRGRGAAGSLAAESAGSLAAERLVLAGVGRRDVLAGASVGVLAGASVGLVFGDNLEPAPRRPGPSAAGGGPAFGFHLWPVRSSAGRARFGESGRGGNRPAAGTGRLAGLAPSAGAPAALPRAARPPGFRSAGGGTGGCSAAPRGPPGHTSSARESQDGRTGRACSRLGSDPVPPRGGAGAWAHGSSPSGCGAGSQGGRPDTWAFRAGGGRCAAVGARRMPIRSCPAPPDSAAVPVPAASAAGAAGAGNALSGMALASSLAGPRGSDGIGAHGGVFAPAAASDSSPADEAGSTGAARSAGGATSAGCAPGEPGPAGEPKLADAPGPGGGVGAAANPDDADPAKPEDADPANPDSADPVKPEEDPVKPDDPVKPGDADPVKPEDPAKPVEADPAKVGAADPAKVGEADPVEAGGADPVKVGEADPVKAGGADPVKLGAARSRDSRAERCRDEPGRLEFGRGLGIGCLAADGCRGPGPGRGSLLPGSLFAGALLSCARFARRDLGGRAHLGEPRRPGMPPPPRPDGEDGPQQEQEDDARDGRIHDQLAADVPVDRAAVHRRGRGRRRGRGGGCRLGHGLRDARSRGERPGRIDGAEARAIARPAVRPEPSARW